MCVCACSVVLVLVGAGTLRQCLLFGVAVGMRNPKVHGNVQLYATAPWFVSQFFILINKNIQSDVIGAHGYGF